jgi:predicted transport protein
MGIVSKMTLNFARRLHVRVSYDSQNKERLCPKPVSSVGRCGGGAVFPMKPELSAYVSFRLISCLKVLINK